MTVIEFIIVGVLVVGLGYFVLIYNGLIRLKNNVERAFANIEVLLKQRHTELPQLVEVCRGYMQHEKDLLVAITRARTHVFEAQEDHNIKKLGRAETQMRESLSHLFFRVEAYPELKANENFLALQERISQLEDAIADRREIYNESVRLKNTRIQQFPDVLVARMFKFEAEDYLKFEAGHLQPVSISGAMNG